MALVAWVDKSESSTRKLHCQQSIWSGRERFSLLVSHVLAIGRVVLKDRLKILPFLPGRVVGLTNLTQSVDGSLVNRASSIGTRG